MQLGKILGRDSNLLRDLARKWEASDIRRKQARELQKRRRKGKTIKYKRDDEGRS